MKTGFKLVAALAAAAVMMCAPAVANAAPAVTITTDTGQPAVLAPGTNPTLRNMSVETALTVADADAMRWTWSVIGPDGVAAVTESSCWSINTDGRRVPYRGNGTYTLTLKAYAANACTGTPVVTTYTWTVGASVAIGQPAGPLPTRPANTAVTNTLMLDFAGNPGATTNEIRYAKGAVLAADGSISGPSETAFVDSTTGKIRFSNFAGPGTYTFVARAQTGDFYTPWSPPANVTLIAPFDLRTAQLQRPPRTELPAARRGPRGRGRRRPRDGRDRQGQERQALPHAGPRQDQQQGRVQAPVHAAQARLVPPALLVQGLFGGRARHRLRAGALPARDRLVTTRQSRSGARLPILRV